MGYSGGARETFEGPLLDDDPLDASGARGENLLIQGRPHTAARMAWAAVWSKFPLYSDKPKLRELMRSFERDDVTVVVSGTGSGKTVLAVPLMLMTVRRRLGVASARLVAVTIPKRTAVALAAQTGARTLDVELGAQVGYQFRGSPREAFDRSRTRLVYCTDGTLLAQARTDPQLSAYSAIVVDEAHERPVPTDMLLAAVRNAQRRRRSTQHPLRLCIMSATIDPALFVAYYESAGLSVGVVQIAGQPNHPIQRIFDPEEAPPAAAAAAPAPERKDAAAAPPVPGKMERGPEAPQGQQHQYMDRAVQAAAAMLTTTVDAPRGKTKAAAAAAAAAALRPRILVFVPTTKDTIAGCRRLGAPADGACTSMYGKMQQQQQQQQQGSVANEQLSPQVRTIFATNVAESSVTIPDVTHVVDTGLQLNSVWDPMTHGTVLSLGRATRAQVLQRIGRTGRTGPGVARMLYTERAFDSLPAYPEPAVRTVDLTDDLLRMLLAPGATLCSALRDLRELITPPRSAQLASALALLHFYGIVDVGPGLAYEAVPYATFDDEASWAKFSEGADVCGAEPANVTAFGRHVGRVMTDLRMSAWNALLVCTGIVHGAADDATALALLLDEVGGDFAALWVVAEDDSGPPATPPAVLRIADRDSDHVTLLNVLRRLAAPHVDDPNRLIGMGLSPGKWGGIVRRVRSGASHARIPAQALVGSCPARLSWPKGHHRPPQPAPLTLALAAARMFHAAARRPDGTLRSVVPFRPVSCRSTMFAAASPSPARWAVYEQLVTSNARTRMTCITRLAQGGRK